MDDGGEISEGKFAGSALSFSYFMLNDSTPIIHGGCPEHRIICSSRVMRDPPATKMGSTPHITYIVPNSPRVSQDDVSPKSAKTTTLRISFWCCQLPKPARHNFLPRHTQRQAALLDKFRSPETSEAKGSTMGSPASRLYPH